MFWYVSRVNKHKKEREKEKEGRKERQNSRRDKLEMCTRNKLLYSFLTALLEGLNAFN